MEKRGKNKQAQSQSRQQGWGLSMARVAVLSISPGLSRSHAAMLVIPHLKIASEEQVYIQGRQAIPRAHLWLCRGSESSLSPACHAILLQQVDTVCCEMVRDCGQTPPAFGHSWQTGNRWAQRMDQGRRGFYLLQGWRRESEDSSSEKTQRSSVTIRMTPWAAMEIMLFSKLTKQHGCYHEIPQFTAQGRGKLSARNSYNQYMDLMGKGTKVLYRKHKIYRHMHQDCLIDRSLDEEGEGQLKKRLRKTLARGGGRISLPQGRWVQRTWPAAHTRTEAMATERDTNPLVVQGPEPGQEPADLLGRWTTFSSSSFSII